MQTWVTSDIHFFHKRILDFCKGTRPWENVGEMNEGLIEAWNSTVARGDIIYFLGDFSFGSRENTEKILQRLHGQKYLVYGNHDQQLREGWAEKYFKHRADLLRHKIMGHDIVMCHYPIARWEKAHYGSLHLFGHEHGGYQGQGRSMDVGWDVAGKIFDMEEIIEILLDKEVLAHHNTVKVD